MYPASDLALYVLVKLIAEILTTMGSVWEDLAWDFWYLPWGFLNARIALILGIEIWRMRKSMTPNKNELISALIEDFSGGRTIGQA